MRLYRLLLHLYPKGFRSEYGEELCQVFAQRRRNASNPASVLALWLDELKDIFLNAAHLHADIFRQDLRYAARTLGRAPGFALAAILVTALGIGANTAVFSITDRALIRPLPFADSERLVKLWENPPGYARMELSPANYRDWRRLSTSFETMAAFHEDSMNLVGVGDPQRLDGALVTADLLPLLGIEPLSGRLFTAGDDREGAPGTLLLSYGLWKGVFGGNPAALGQSVRLDDETYVITGVMPEAFFFPDREARFWVAKRLRARDFEDRDDNYLQVLAKLRPNVSLEQARAEMRVIAEQLEGAFPKENARTGANVIRLRDEMSEQARLLLAALFGASTCVLLIACTNLANLLLARALGRRNELSVRMAIGAGRERLVRQLLTESLLLAFLGGLMGVMVAMATTPLLARLVPTSLPIGGAAAIDFRVLVFAALLTGVTGIGFGVLPALRIGGGADAQGLREGSRGGLGGRTERLRSALVMAEVTASVVLLISAGLLIQALWRIQAIDPGFRTDAVLTLRTPLPMPKYDSTARRVEFYSRVLSEVRALPAVSNAGYISFLPMTMRGGIWPVQIEGVPDADGSQRAASLRFVTPGYFSALRIPLTLGRDLSESDTLDRPLVALVSESFVRRYWPGDDPLGRRFQFGFQERTVVGVVGDVRFRGLERTSEPQVYLPYKQVPDGAIGFYAPKDLVIHSSSDPEPLLPAVRRIIQNTDPELPVSDVRLLADVVDAETAPRRTQIRVLGVFAVISLLLAGIGIHGLLSFAVSQRTSEIGLRMALGARSGDILTLVLRQGALLAATGAVLGLLLAYAAGRAMEALLAGVKPGDLVTFLTASALAFLMTLSGSLLPALRAVRVDPTTAIRTE